MYRYTLDFTDRHRHEIEAVDDLQALDSLLSAYDLIGEFTAYAERHGLSTNHRELATSRDIILAQIRAYIARNAFDDESGFYYNILPIDDAMLRAVEEMKKELANNKR